MLTKRCSNGWHVSEFLWTSHQNSSSRRRKYKTNIEVHFWFHNQSGNILDRLHRTKQMPMLMIGCTRYLSPPASTSNNPRPRSFMTLILDPFALGHLTSSNANDAYHGMQRHATSTPFAFTFSRVPTKVKQNFFRRLDAFRRNEPHSVRVEPCRRITVSADGCHHHRDGGNIQVGRRRLAKRGFGGASH